MSYTTMKVLAVSDKVLDSIYSADVAERFTDVDLVLGCGDLPYYYLEFLIDALDAPVFYVRGNHDPLLERGVNVDRREPRGATDLDGRTVVHDGLLLAGLEGSLRYKEGPFMSTQAEMWWKVLMLIPRLLLNRLRYGRYLDVLVTHAPPWGIHDKPDLAHTGFKAIRWLLETFRPPYHFHGHVHVYSNQTTTQTRFADTLVINSFGYCETVIEPPSTATLLEKPLQEGKD